MVRPFQAIFLGTLLFAIGHVAPALGGDDRWADFRFLIGSWVGEGPPAQGSGSFSLEPDLENKILLRRNTAYVPATKSRPAARHEDLMVIYPDQAAKGFRAVYFDNEGHVIEYSVTALPAGKGLVFLGAAAPSTPRFRLTYIKTEGDKVAIEFEIAPPGQPERFRRYLAGTARRKQPVH